MTISRVTRTGSNVFDEIGFGPDEAEHLRIRSQLMITIRQIIEEQALKQKGAVERIAPRHQGLAHAVVDTPTVYLSHAAFPVAGTTSMVHHRQHPQPLPISAIEHTVWESPEEMSTD